MKTGQKQKKDHFPNLTALKQKLKEGDDYRINVLDRAGEFTIIAPHGGFIDCGTSAIARAIAGRNHNLFDFQGLRENLSWELHVTSTRFRDPVLSRMLSQSTLAVAVHCMGYMDTQIWLGGLNFPFRDRLGTLLKEAGFQATSDNKVMRGEHPKNVVNLAKEKGVQIELPTRLIQDMISAPYVFRKACSYPPLTALGTRFIAVVRQLLTTIARKNFKP